MVDQLSNPNQFQYPPVPIPTDDATGIFPVDFLLQTVLEAGLNWFRTDSDAPKAVYGHLMNQWLGPKYGEDKIKEIADYVKKYEIRIVQHFALIAEQLPCISIQLLDGSEMTERASIADYDSAVDVLDFENNVKGRTQLSYSPILDNIHIGIHNTTTPDLTKYLYYLVLYILNIFKPQLEQRGLQLGTYRSTDLSKLNEYLPSNVYSRFINFSVYSSATFNKGGVPILEDIIGVSVPLSDTGIADINLGVIPDGGA